MLSQTGSYFCQTKSDELTWPVPDGIDDARFNVPALAGSAPKTPAQLEATKRPSKTEREATMKAQSFCQMEPGTILLLKPERMEAYDQGQQVVFDKVKKDTQGRKTPWIISAEGGSYRPSDFINKGG